MSETLNNLRQNMQHLQVQKQSLQSQLMEIDTALRHVNDDTSSAYMTIGNIMVAKTPTQIRTELNEQRGAITAHIEQLDQQYDQIKQRHDSMTGEHNEQ